ncbi:MAG: hypothetical protein E7033_01250 [Akkermansiaceae bacterium]|nr:hypothetical protein [Akkermansiaceae bacterium]
MSNKEFTGHPDARRPKNNPFAWINLAFLTIIVICCNYIGCREYGRLDLSEYESYSISERTLNVLSSEQVQKIESPIRIIFAFPGSSPGYHRMYLLLEEYKRHAKGKIEIECFDPLRQPGRAREVAHTYNVKFDQAYCIVDARTDKDMRVSHSEVSPDDAGRYRCIPGSTFLRYETQPDGKRNVVALMMDEVLCNEIIKTVEGNQRKMYVVTNLSGGVQQDSRGNLVTAPISLLNTIASSVNIKLEPIRLAQVESSGASPAQSAEKNEIPQDAEGLIIIARDTDLTPYQINIIRKFWEEREGVALFIGISGQYHTYSQASNQMVPTLVNLNKFIEENGIHPNGDDRILLKSSRSLDDNISVSFPEGLACTQNFWNTTALLDGRSQSFSLFFDNESDASARRLNTYPLIMASKEYYGERTPGTGARCDANDVNADGTTPLYVTVAATKGSQTDKNKLNTMVVTGNLSMLSEDGARKEIRDYLRSVYAWMVERPQYAGKSNNYDLSVKIDLNRHSRSAVEHLTLIIMPLLALLVAFVIWNTRRH